MLMYSVTTSAVVCEDGRRVITHTWINHLAPDEPVPAYDVCALSAYARDALDTDVLRALGHDDDY